MQIELEPRPRPAIEKPRVAVAPAGSSHLASAVPQTSRPISPEALKAGPAYPLPSDQTPAATGPDHAAVARGLAGLFGCHDRSRLTPEQRDRCDARLAARANGPPIRDLDADARFMADGRRALSAHAAQREPLAGGAGVMGPADCVGSNLGAGCAGAHLPLAPGVDMRQGATTNIRQRSNKLD